MIVLFHNNIERAVIYMTVGEKIVETRKAKGITQKQLAEMTGIPVQTLVRYEKGGNIPADRMFDITFALETTPARLMGCKPATDENISIVIESLRELGASSGDILAMFSTQELAEEIAKRCGDNEI